MGKEKYVIIGVFMLSLIVPNDAFSKEWFSPMSNGDIIGEIPFMILLGIDYLQTVEFTQNTNMKETNQALGEDPSIERLNVYNVFWLIFHPFVTYILPAEYRQDWQIVSVIVEYSHVNKNYNNGIRIGIGF